MNITLPSGLTIEGIPDNLSREEIKVKLIASGKAKEADFMSRDEVLENFDAIPENQDNLIEQESPETPYKFSPAAMAFNTPGSVGQLVADMTYPIRHPKKTMEGIRSISTGLYSKLSGGESPDEATVEAIGQYIIDRYGSVDNALQTLENDPAGMLSDVAGVLSMGGSIAAKLPGKMGAIGEGARDVGNLIDPINIAATTLYEVPKKIQAGKKDPIGEMLEATKFGTTLDVKFGVGKRRELAETMLENNYTLDDAGIAKLEADMASVGLKIEDVMNSPKAMTRTLHPNESLQHMSKFKREQTGRTKTHSIDNANAIDNTTAPWRAARAKEGNVAMSAAEMNALKQDAYKNASYDKGDSAALSMDAEANRAWARGAKDAVNRVVPEVMQYNDEYGKLTELRPHLIRSAGRVSNNSPRGLFPLIRAGVAGVVGSSVDPYLGAILAGNELYKGGKLTGKGKAIVAQENFNLQKKGYTQAYKDKGFLPRIVSSSMFSGRAIDELYDDEVLQLPNL